MPQMMPMNWILLFMFFIFIYMMFNMMNFYSINYTINKNPFINFMNNSMTWKW